MSDRQEFDAIIVGAGPAGMAAAVAFAERGGRVCLIDDQPGPGGQIWRGREAHRSAEVLQALGAEYSAGAEAIARFRAARVDYRPLTQMWEMEPTEQGWHVFTKHAGRASAIGARTVLLATGAQERPAPLPGWTLPGVMTVGGAQILLKTSAQVPHGPVWIAGSGPLPLLYITQLLELGVRIAGYLDTSPGVLRAPVAARLPGALGGWRDIAKGLGWLARLRRAGISIHRGVREIEAIGEDRLRQIRFRGRDDREVVEPAGNLLVHEGVVPQVHTTMALGCAHDWSAAQGCFAPRHDAWGATSLPGFYVAGDGGGIVGARAAEIQGQLAGLGMARDLGLGSGGDTEAAGPQRRLAALSRARAFLDAVYPPPEGAAAIGDEVVVCRCEEVTAGTLRAACRQSGGSPDQVKAFTRAGMGPCQGRQCGYTVSRILADLSDVGPEEIGFFRIRPPLRPVTLGELAGMAEKDADQ